MKGQFCREINYICLATSADSILSILAWLIAVHLTAITFPEIDFRGYVKVKPGKVINTKQAEYIIRAKSKKMIPHRHAKSEMIIIIKRQW
jgi:hypothetical protein